MKLSARDTKIFDDVLVYAKKNQEKDEKAKMFVAYSEKENLTKSELGYIKNYISVYRLNDQIERKHQREKTKEMNVAGKRRKALNAAKFGLGGWVIGGIAKNEETNPKIKDLFRMVGVMAGFVDLPDNHKLSLLIFNNEIQLMIRKKEIKNELDNGRTALIFNGLDNSKSLCHATENCVLRTWISKREKIEEDFNGRWEDSNNRINLSDEDSRWVLYFVMRYLETKGYLEFNSVSKSWVWEDKYIYRSEGGQPQAYLLEQSTT